MSMGLSIFFTLITGHSSLSTVFAAQSPSLFRGIVVANSDLGARIISIEDGSQAALVDLRPEDVIVRINDNPIKTIDEFAVVSESLKGKAANATLVVMRNGEPRQVLLHLYSIPVLRQWGLWFIPEYEFRFADSKAGVAYWVRMGRGFEEAHRPADAVNAYLNALHNDPTQLDVAVEVTRLLWQIAKQHLEQHHVPDALASIQQGTTIFGKLMDQPLDETQLKLLRHELQETLDALHRVTHHAALDDKTSVSYTVV